MYEVEDIMEEDAMDDDTGGKIKYACRVTLWQDKVFQWSAF
jgi:hypothetical protein